MKASIRATFEVLDFFGYIEETQSREQYASLVGGMTMFHEVEIGNLHETKMSNVSLSVSIGYDISKLVSHPYGSARTTSPLAVSGESGGSVIFKNSFTLSSPSLSPPIQLVLTDVKRPGAYVRFSLDVQNLADSDDGEHTYLLEATGLPHEEGWISETTNAPVVPYLKLRATFNRGGPRRS